MKKLILCFMAIMLAIPMMLSGCSNELKYISDGDFKYYYMEDKDSYAVIGTTEQGKGQEVLYFPSYYNDKLVTHMGYAKTTGYMSVDNHYWIEPDDITATKVYFPYTVEEKYYTNVIFKNESEGQIYFTNCNRSYLESAVLMAGPYGIRKGVKYFATPSAYEYIINNIKISGMDNNGDVNKANMSYIFNYEDAPNEGYFFIDNYDAGSIIKNTPYEPKREGYTFDGWYKEAECENAWDFEEDTFSLAEGQDIMNLYAKWL